MHYVLLFSTNTGVGRQGMKFQLMLKIHPFSWNLKLQWLKIV